MTDIPDTIGRYQVISQLGQAGASALYCAWDAQRDSLAAIKILIANDDGLRERFRDAARSLALLRHPHVACICEVGEDQQRPFVVMEYVEGRTLGDRIHFGPSLSTRRRLRAMRELCDGLAFAHRSSIVHGDIRPANLMLDGDDALKIVGFDIARPAPAMTGQPGAAWRPLNYLSPEQVGGRPADQRSDIFAVGAVFYELISGRQAFPGNLENGVLERISRGEPDPLALSSRPVDPDIVRIVDRCLAKGVDRRFPDLGAVLGDIDRVLTRLPEEEDVSNARRSRWIPRVVRRGTQSASDVTPRTVDQTPMTPPETTPMQRNLERAQQALAAGDHDGVIEACEHALLLDCDDQQAFDLLDRTRTAIDERNSEGLLNQAEEELRCGAPAAARDLVERAAALAPALPRIAELRRSAGEAVTLREQERQRGEAVWRLLEHGEELFDRGLWREAVGAAEQALALEAESAEARLLKLRATDAIEAHQRAELERRVGEAVRESKQLFDTGNHEQALELLTRFEPTHDRISRARDQLQAAAARIAEQRRDAERRARQQRIGAEITSAREELAQGRFGDARARLQTVQAAEGESADIDLALAAVEGAQAAAEQRARLQRDLVEHVARAAGLWARNDAAAALSRVDAALAIDPHHGSATALKARIQDALQTAAHRAETEQRLACDREQRIARALEAAQLAASHALAVNSLNEVLEHDPTHALARQLLAQRREAQAREQAERQRRLDADRMRREQVNQLVESGRQALQRGDPVTARDLAQHALEHDAEADSARQLLDDIVLFEEDRVLSLEHPRPDREDLEPTLEEHGPSAEDHSPSIEDRVPAPPEKSVTAGAALSAEEPPGTADQSTEPVVQAETTGLPHRPWLMILIAAAVVAAVAATGYFAIDEEPPATRQSGAEHTPPVEEPVASAGVRDAGEGAISRQVAERQARAEQAFARGDWQQGLTAVEEAFHLRPDDVALEDVLLAALQDARARTMKARDAAQQAGAVGSLDFRNAEQKRREADRLARAGQSHEAIRALWDGIQLLERARGVPEKKARP